MWYDLLHFPHLIPSDRAVILNVHIKHIEDVSFLFRGKLGAVITICDSMFIFLGTDVLAST